MFVPVKFAEELSKVLNFERKVLSFVWILEDEEVFLSSVPEDKKVWSESSVEESWAAISE